MFFSDKDIASWKEDIKSQDNNRKNGQFPSNTVKYTKPVTWRDVKQKEMEYHPILQKYAASEKENNQKVKEEANWKNRADVAKKHVEKYAIDYNIINLEKDNSVPARPEKDLTAGRLMPKAQVDYNIINNNKLDDLFLKNFHPDAKKTSQGSPRNKGKVRDFNIVSNKYYTDHDHKTNNDNIRINEDWKNKFDKTHDYNPILAEFYDNSKEAAFLEKREKDMAEHGKSKLENLPPTIKNREMIIFDPTREVPEAIKVLDQKKKDAMKKYELRYKVEDQLRERDIEYQTKTEQMKLNRVHDKKFAEVYEKGFDMITLNDYTKDNMNFQPKPTQTKWEKIKVNANPVQTLESKIGGSVRPALSANDLKEAKPQIDANPTYKTTGSSGWNNTMKSGSVGGYEVLRGKLEEDTTTRHDPFTIREFKSAAQRAREPTFNLADQYNQYCVPPKRVMDDFNTRTLPQIKVPDTTLKFALSKTGGFKKGETVA